MSQIATQANQSDDKNTAPNQDLLAYGGALSEKGQRWQRRPADPRLMETLTQKFTISPLLARVMAGRGVTLEMAEQFLHPSLRTGLPDPLIMAGMDETIDRLVKAIVDNQTIAVFGDYDVDGTSSAALLTRYFTDLGITPLVHLPDRFTEGYGPSHEAFADLKQKGADLIITVDCGAMAHEVIEGAKTEGLGVIVLDHHQIGLPMPPADGLVNPNRPDDISGLTMLSAAGVSFMTLIALNRALREAGYFATRPEPDLRPHLDIVALGLVCDVMPLRGLTRLLVAQGLKRLGRFDKSGDWINHPPAFPGLQALAAAVGADGPASTYHLGFVLGPRINAAGRIGHANLAFRLMCERDPLKARQWAEQLHNLNAERQHVEQEVVRAAIQTIEGSPSSALIVTAGEDWHLGVIGIAAGRIKEKYQKPALIISVTDGIGKGSGRSIPGIDLGAAITKAAEQNLLIGGGGHAMACGFTIDAKNIDHFRTFLEQELAQQVIHARAAMILNYDGTVPAAQVGRPLCDEIGAASPYGAGNSEPVFVLEEMQILYPTIRGEAHIACTLQDRMGRKVRAITFRAVDTPLGDSLMAAQDQPGLRYHVAGKIKPDEWRGGDAAQMIIEDMMSATPKGD